MKIPSECPLCQGMFKKTYFENPVTNGYFVYACTHVSHDIRYLSYNSEDNLTEEIRLKIPEVNYTIFWNFINNSFTLFDPKINKLINKLPWIAPDFSNRNRLIKKIKTVLTFL